MIDAAKHYIFIEVSLHGKNESEFSLMQNQFFITTDDDPDVKNQLAEALFRRVLRAHA